MTAPVPLPAGRDRPPGGRWMRAVIRRVLGRRGARPHAVPDLAGILDLFEELVYAGEVTPAGNYVHHSAGPTVERFLGGSETHRRRALGRCGSARVHADDRDEYDRFNLRLLRGEDAEVTYRLHGLDGVTRILWDRARPRRRPDGSVLVRGIISDVTRREEGDTAPGRGQRALHPPARRHRRARVPGAVASRRTHRGAVPGARRGPAAGRRRARRRDGELGRRPAPGGPGRLRGVQRRARRREGEATSSTG